MRQMLPGVGTHETGVRTGGKVREEINEQREWRRKKELLGSRQSISSTRFYSCLISFYCCSLSHVQLCYPMDCSTPAFPVLHYLLEFAQNCVHWVDDPIQPSYLLLPTLLLTSIFPSIRVFSKELALHIRWPQFWSFSICPSNEYSGLVSFRMNWFDLLAVQGTLKTLLQHPIQKH